MTDWLPRPDLFWAKVKTGDPDGCWEWQAAVDGDGYGRVYVRRDGGRRSWRAHRAAWEMTRGPIPDGLTLDHLCRNRICVNPAHLEPVPGAINTQRGGNTVKMTCANGHPFDETNTYRRPDGSRRTCRKCRVIFTTKWRAKRKQADDGQ